MKIKLTKLSVALQPDCPTAAKNNWIAGQENPNLSPPINYYIEGELLDDIEVGEYIIVDRCSRNGIIVQGIFISSLIERIEEDKIFTKNSIYKIEYL